MRCSALFIALLYIIIHQSSALQPQWKQWKEWCLSADPAAQSRLSKAVVECLDTVSVPPAPQEKRQAREPVKEHQLLEDSYIGSSLGYKRARLVPLDLYQRSIETSRESSVLRLGRYVKRLLRLRTKDKRLCWRPSQEEGVQLVKRSGALAHVLSWNSSAASTDSSLRGLYQAVVARLKPNPPLPTSPDGQYVAAVVRLVMFVCSTRNDPKLIRAIQPGVFFYYDSNTANFWLSALLREYEGVVSEERAFANLQYFLNTSSWWQPWNTFDEKLNSIYYAASYVSPWYDKPLKTHINKVLQSPDEEVWQRAVLRHRWGRSKKRMKQPFRWHRVSKDDDARVNKGHSARNLRLLKSLSAFSDPTKGRRTRRLRVAVITQFWFHRHSVYRTLAGYVEALHASGHFELELLLIGTPVSQSVSTSFDAVHVFDHPSDLQKAIDIMAHMRQNLTFNFDVAYFPDVGMSWSSIFLANKRVAPLMISSVGHSVSSYGSLMDFFMSGDETEYFNRRTGGDGSGHSGEVPPNRASASSPWSLYSERLALLPGAGVVHNHPSKTISADLLKAVRTVRPQSRGRAKPKAPRETLVTTPRALDPPVLYSNGLMRIPGLDTAVSPTVSSVDLPQRGREQSERIIISCPASTQKLNVVFLKSMARVLQQAKHNVTIRIFTGLTFEHEMRLAIITRAVARALGIPLERARAITLLNATASPEESQASRTAQWNEPTGGHQVEVLSLQDYDVYLRESSRGHFVVEPFHYGGCNTVVDSLYTGTPIITREGFHWYNRIGTQILRKVGLDEVLSTKSEDEFVQRAVSFVNEPKLLQDAIDTVNSEKVQSKLEFLYHRPGEHFASQCAGLLHEETDSLALSEETHEASWFPAALEFLVALQRYTLFLTKRHATGFDVREVGTEAAFHAEIVPRAPILLREWLSPWLQGSMSLADMFGIVEGKGQEPLRMSSGDGHSQKEDL